MDSSPKGASFQFRSQRVHVKMLFHLSIKTSFKLPLLLLALVIIILPLIQQVSSSGIFEINFSSLVDNLGHDLREDCCSWQQKLAASQQQQSQSLQQQQAASANQQQQQNFQQCDPSKCQLIIRICVKNYQTQIDPSQCTFGELSAQVMKPNEANPFANYPPIQFNQLGGNPAAATIASNNLHPRRLFQSTSATNIHHQRMKQQQQLLSANHHYSALSFQHNKQQSSSGPSAGQSRFYPSQRGLRSVAFNQPISFPFNFTWPGEFSLIVDAWFETPTELSGFPPGVVGSSLMQQTTYDLYKKQLIIKHSMHGWLGVKNEWTNEVHKTDLATLTYSYRVTCQPNYYGEKCNILCRPRDGVFGHFTCSPQGDIVCRPGWQGSYCSDPICSPGCHKNQGNCSRPNECNCRIGWEGPSCEQCVRFPGCVHGFCSRPNECICQEGWGGLLCNEDLNYCTNHRPCKNEATCTNTFDSNGAGSYTCDCLPGFSGKDCETSSQQLDSSLFQMSTPLQVQAPNLEINNSSSMNNNIPKQASYSPQSPSASHLNPPSSQISTTHHNHHHHHSSQAKPHRNIVPPTTPPTTTTTSTPPATLNAAAMVPTTHAPQLHQHQQVASLVGPFMHHYTTQPVTAQQHPASVPFDNRVVAAYGIIIVCMVILVVILLLRIFFERTNQRHWHQESSQVEDVATLQNHQNIYKSRTSLSTAATCTTDKMMPYDTLDSSQDSSSASTTSSSSSIASSTAPTSAAGYNHHGYGHHHHNARNHHLSSQHCISSSSSNNNTTPSTAHERRAHYRSHHNLHNTGAQQAASSSAGGPLNPPPPYTISHSHPNSTTYMDYNNSIYNLSLANHPSHHQAAAGSLYGVHSTYGQIPAPAATNSIYQSPYYVICRLVDPVDPLNAAATNAPAPSSTAQANANKQSCAKSGNKFKAANGDS